MFKGNKIYYITAAALAFCLWAADYGLTAAVDMEQYYREDVEQ